MVQVYFLTEFVSKCLALKRAKHKLTKNDKAMIVCDKAPCHLHQAFRVLRKTWGLLNNCVIFGDDVNAEIEVPAGIGGCGAPNDAFHQFVHYARRYLERQQMGHTEVLAMRTSFYEAGCNPTGCTERKLNYKTAILNDLSAIDCVRQYKGGKIIMYAWLVTGLVTPKLLAKWHCNGNEDAFNESMKRTIGEFKDLLRRKFQQGNKTDPALVTWRQQTWASLQKTKDTAEKIWAYWENPGKGHSDNVEVNRYILIFSV